MRREGGIRNMTKGSPLRHIVLFTLPLLAGNFLQQFYNMVDSWVVGNYVSDAALAAVGVGFPVIFLFTSLFSGIAIGGTVVIAQAFGAGKPERVRSTIDSLYTAFARSILPITVVSMLLVEPLMTVLRVDPADPKAVSVAVEVWQGPAAGLASVLMKEPEGLSVGKVTLSDGEVVLGVIGEPELVRGQKEISSYGGWRSYIASL